MFDFWSKGAAMFSFAILITTGLTEVELEVKRNDDLSGHCQPHRCELLKGIGCRPNYVCDMYRDECIAVCNDADCCTSIKCPPGTACISGTGRCGIPRGEGCYDLGESWWTGRDSSVEERGSTEPQPLTFLIRNDRDVPIYLVLNQLRQPRFDLTVESCDKSISLDIPENVFCPIVCTPSGLAMEVDCGPPRISVYKLMPGEQVSTAWSGLERVETKRWCTNKEQTCHTDYPSIAADYLVKVSAYLSVIGGYQDVNEKHRSHGVSKLGEPLIKIAHFSRLKKIGRIVFN